MARGAFIVIDGPNGSGKATQILKLVSRLTKEGLTVETIEFPRYGEKSAFFAEQYIHGAYGEAHIINPYTASLFFALDRYQSGQAIQKALQAGSVVIANRYTGSNMATQGAKFAHPDERKGYYLWIDSIEYQTLNIPRPDKSIILRTKDSKTTSFVTDAQVYDELCDLFPNDYFRLDCLRGGILLEADVVSDMIWNVVQPLLPEPSIQQPKHYHLRPELPAKHNQAVTTTVLSMLRESRIANLPAEPTFYDICITEPNLRKEYVDTLESITQLRRTILQQLTIYLRGSSSTSLEDELKVINNLLPYGTVMHTDQQILDKSQGSTDFTTYARKLLPDNHSSATDEPQLVSVWPRNEFDLLPEMLYQQGNTPLTTIRKAVDTWSMRQKQETLQKYIESVKDDSCVLGRYTYDWDVLISYDTAVSLAQSSASLLYQEFTPRYGYSVPKIIEAADAVDMYEQCFYLSLRLYSTLLAAGNTEAAQYAVLLGHKQRCVVHTTAVDILNIKNQIASTMIEKLAEIHPLVMTSMQYKRM